MRTLLVLLAACGSEPAPPDAMPQKVGLGVIVESQAVRVFMDDCNGDTVPLVGSNTSVGDIGCETCLDHLAIGDAALDISLSAGPLPFVLNVDVRQQPDAVLEIEGCGGAAKIPIGGLTIPTPSASARWLDPENGLVEVAWSGDHAETALLWFFFGLWDDVEQVATNRFVFAPPFPAVPMPFVQVETLGPEVPVATPFGIVRVWAGATTFAALPELP